MDVKINKKMVTLKDSSDSDLRYGFAVCNKNLKFEDEYVMRKGTIVKFFIKSPEDDILLSKGEEYWHGSTKDILEHDEYHISAKDFAKAFTMLDSVYFIVREDEQWQHFSFKAEEVYLFAGGRFTHVDLQNRSKDDIRVLRPYEPDLCWGTSYGEDTDILNFFADENIPTDWFVHIPDLEKYKTTKKFGL
jgi:hypothetical protein